jgi:uncharacterized iron-regulated membrane protein
MATVTARSTLYRSIWRWHFYAGLFVIPLILILSITGGLYLFKPQVERWEERAWQGLPEMAAVTPEAQRDAALASFPGAMFHSYRIPRQAGDAALIRLGLPGKTGTQDVFVSPQGKVLGSLDPEWRIMQVAHDIHGQLLLGKRGSWIVELAASWAIVMTVTGLYLWWPTGGGLAGVIWPRLGRGSKVMWRDLHAVTGFWVSGLALVLLITGLPWADVWGSAFKAVRQEMGWVKGPQDWTIGGQAPDAGEHAMHMDHNPAAMMAMPEGARPGMAMPDKMMHEGAHGMSPVALSEIAARARSEHLAFPVLITPPGAPQRFGQKAAATWTVKSDAPNRPLRVTISYDAMTGAETSRETFADKHVIDRVVGYGVAWHEGALFGLANQLIGLATAAALITLALTGFVLWRRRKPGSRLGAPPAPHAKLQRPAIKLVIALLMLTLPMFAISAAAIWLFDRVALTRLPRLAHWLGAAPPA